MNRLTKDHPEGNLETLMNFAYVKGGDVWLRRAAEDGSDLALNAYISDVSKRNPVGCGLDTEDVPDACCDGCFCELGALFAAATQAAELRARLAAYEDTGLEPEEVREMMVDWCVWKQADAAHRLIVLPVQVGDPVYCIAHGRCDHYSECQDAEICDGFDHTCEAYLGKVELGTCTFELDLLSEVGKSVFLTEKEAVKALFPDQK